MAKIKKIKIYTHHRRYFKRGSDYKSFGKRLLFNIANGFVSVFYFFGLIVLKFFQFFKNTVIASCFHTGNIIIGSILKTANGIKKDFINTEVSLSKRFKLLSNTQFSRGLLIFLICAGVGYAALASLGLVAQGLEIKAKVLLTASFGNNYLLQAKNDLSSQDFSQAQNRFALAYQTFSQGQQEFSQNGQALSQLMNLLPQKQDADRLLQAAGLVAQAGQNFVGLEQNFKNLKITTAGVGANGQNVPQIFRNISSELSQAQQEITQANSNLGQVNQNNVPSGSRETFVQLKDQLSNGQTALDNLSQIFNLAQNLLLGQKNILVVFENNNELRATGGFMGTYGNLSLNNGSLTKITVSSIYDLDGQLTDVIKPPKPILNVSDRWYLRDSNWFADFPTSAKTITNFYEKEGGQTPDMVIALTPNLIIDWLKLTGPITLPKYNLTLTADNFVEQTQVNTTMDDSLPTNSPKQLLADLVPVLIQKMSQLDKSQWPQIIQSIQDNLNNKQIVIYSRDQNTQAQLQAFDWTGNLSPTDRDYLSIVSSNLDGTKTDLFVTQQANLTTSIAPDGSVTNELDITRTNTLPKLDYTNNLSYLRIYVPLGSKLVSDIGFDYKNLEYPPNDNYETDPDVVAWEQNSFTDNLTGTTIGQETGKTFFGNWVSLDGGQSKTVKLVYTLPFKLNNIDRYSLLAQKQIGSVNSNLNWTLSFPGYQIAWKNFDPTTLNTDNLNSAIIMDKDYFLGMVLQKR